MESCTDECGGPGWRRIAYLDKKYLIASALQNGGYTLIVLQACYKGCVFHSVVARLC